MNSLGSKMNSARHVLLHEENLRGKNIIAVTGGSTMAAVAEMMTPLTGKT